MSRKYILNLYIIINTGFHIKKKHKQQLPKMFTAPDAYSV